MEFLDEFYQNSIQKQEQYKEYAQVIFDTFTQKPMQFNQRSQKIQEGDYENIEKYLSLLFIRDAMLEKHKKSVEMLLESDLGQNLHFLLLFLKDKNKIDEADKLFENKEINKKFYELLMIIYYEIRSNFKEGVIKEFDNLYNESLEANIPFDLIQQNPILFQQQFKANNKPEKLVKDNKQEIGQQQSLDNLNQIKLVKENILDLIEDDTLSRKQLILYLNQYITEGEKLNLTLKNNKDENSYQQNMNQFDQLNDNLKQLEQDKVTYVNFKKNVNFILALKIESISQIEVENYFENQNLDINTIQKQKEQEISDNQSQIFKYSKQDSYNEMKENINDNLNIDQKADIEKKKQKSQEELKEEFNRNLEAISNLNQKTKNYKIFGNSKKNQIIKNSKKQQNNSIIQQRQFTEFISEKNNNQNQFNHDEKQSNIKYFSGFNNQIRKPHQKSNIKVFYKRIKNNEKYLNLQNTEEIFINEDDESEQYQIENIKKEQYNYSIDKPESFKENNHTLNLSSQLIQKTTQSYQVNTNDLITQLQKKDERIARLQNQVSKLSFNQKNLQNKIKNLEEVNETLKEEIKQSLQYQIEKKVDQNYLQSNISVIENSELDFHREFQMNNTLINQHEPIKLAKIVQQLCQNISQQNDYQLENYLENQICQIFKNEHFEVEIQNLNQLKKEDNFHFRILLQFRNVSQFEINNFQTNLKGQSKQYQLLVNQSKVNKKLKCLEQNQIYLILFPYQFPSILPQMQFSYEIQQNESSKDQINQKMDIVLCLNQLFNFEKITISKFEAFWEKSQNYEQKTFQKIDDYFKIEQNWQKIFPDIKIFPFDKDYNILMGLTSFLKSEQRFLIKIKINKKTFSTQIKILQYQQKQIFEAETQLITQIFNSFDNLLTKTINFYNKQLQLINQFQQLNQINKMKDNQGYDLIVKLVLIGESSVGKTNLLIRYTQNTFRQDAKATIGMDFISEELKIDKYNIKAQFWDTAGQEKYKTIASSYYKIADGVLLVYDVTRRESFVKIQDWLKELKEKCSPGIQIMLVANKIDLFDDRTVSTEEGKEFARNNKLFFYETSALTNDDNCVNKAFDILLKECAKYLYDEFMKEEENDLMNIRKQTKTLGYQEEKKKKCC